MFGTFKNFLTRNGLEAKPFQAECFDWCLKRETTVSTESSPLKASTESSPLKAGGILSLEMGLGKTIIMLSLIECNCQLRTLIILPLALLAQWEAYIKRYFGHNPVVYHGSRPKSLKIPLAQLMQTPIVLTTYGQISLPSVKQLGRGRQLSLLHKVSWNRIICDEAHHVSHKNTNEFKGVQQLQAKIRWLVTGTPIQNSEKELYNLFSLLGLSHSAKYYANGTNYADAVKTLVYHKTKSSAGVKLPELHEHTEIVQWQNESERDYSSHLHSLVGVCLVPKSPIALAIEACEDPRSVRMKYMAKSRQVCIYPPMLKESMKIYERIKGNGGEEGNHPPHLLSDGKMDAVLKTLMARRGNGNGKIVFCHYYAEIDILFERLQVAGGGFMHVRKFDGRLSSKDRRDVLDDKTNEVLLAQIKMCQEGLNLQETYNEVYFPSPDFNPAAEDQAIARCWRLGQTKEVFVFRYVMMDTESHAEPHTAYAESVDADDAESVYADDAESADDDEEFEPHATAYSMDSYSAQLQSDKRAVFTKMQVLATYK